MFFQTGIRIREVRARFADGIDEAKRVAKTVDALAKTQPNNDGHQLQNAHGTSGETLLLDHHFGAAQLRGQMFFH